MQFPRYKCHIYFEIDNLKIAKLFLFGGERHNNYINQNYEVLGFDECSEKVLTYIKDFNFDWNTGYFPHNGFLYFYGTEERELKPVAHGIQIFNPKTELWINYQHDPHKNFKKNSNLRGSFSYFK